MQNPASILIAALNYSTTPFAVTFAFPYSYDADFFKDDTTVMTGVITQLVMATP